MLQANTHAVLRNRGWRISLCLLTVIAALTLCVGANAQSLIGSAGNGWQSWNLASVNSSQFLDLNNNNLPFWDVPLLAFGSYSGNNANKNVGWCLTSQGDCQGVGSALSAPGALPFWGGPYNSATDTGGAIDPKVYFKTNFSGQAFQATRRLLSLAPPVQGQETSLLDIQGVHDLQDVRLRQGRERSNEKRTYPNRDEINRDNPPAPRAHKYKSN